MKNLLLPAALLLILLTVGGYFFLNSGSKMFTTRNSDPLTVKIAVSSPFGLNSGRSTLNGVRLALQEVDYQVGSYKLELIALDDGDATGAWDPKLEEANAKKAASDPQVMAYIGTLNSGAAKISIPILNKAGVVQISQANTWPGLTKPGFADGEPEIFYPTGVRNYFRMVTTDDLQGPAGAQWAQSMGLKRVYVLNDGETYGKGVADLFSKEMRNLKLTVAGEETIETNAGDYSSLVTRIRSANPDMVYFGGHISNGITEIVPQLRASGYKGAIMGPDALLDQSLVTRIGARDAENIFITSVGTPVAQMTSPAAKKFRANYMEEFDAEPEIFGATGYEATRIILDALDKVGANRKLILETVAATKDFETMFGTVSFDENGDVSRKIISANVVRQGSFEFVKELSLQTKK